MSPVEGKEVVKQGTRLAKVGSLPCWFPSQRADKEQGRHGHDEQGIAGSKGRPFGNDRSITRPDELDPLFQGLALESGRREPSAGIFDMRALGEINSTEGKAACPQRVGNADVGIA